MNHPVIVIGGGGHAGVLIATLLLLNRSVVGFVGPSAPKRSIFGIKYLGDDSVLRHKSQDIELVNGVGSIGLKSLRYLLFRRFREQGFRFATVIHPAAVVAADLRLGEGAQIMAGAVIQPGSRIGANCIVNTGAVVDHDCEIRSHAHIAPGAVLCGGVKIGIGAHIGAGASILQEVHVGQWSIVGAGAAVIRDVPAGVTAVGVPAKWHKTAIK
jgi:sugar O-acyltransferase (sialic acid O-acetyltransferase NeuD family)